MRALLVCLATAGLVSCTLTDPSPELATVLDLAPRAPEVGERMELLGTGFPEGKAATITFKGDLHRPGQPVVRGASILLRATGSHGDRVSWLLTEELLGDFSGIGPEATHTTFHGDVVAAFAPRKAGAPPITGSLREVAIDLPPPYLPERVAGQRQAEADRVLGELGLQVGEDSEHRGLVVTGVSPQGRAAQAGLVTGDLLGELDGVHVRHATDLVPRAGQHFAKALVKRPGMADTLERILSVEGLKAAAPAELMPAGVMLGLAAAVLLVLGAPIARLLTWTEGRLARRLREALAVGPGVGRMKTQGVLGKTRRLWSELHSCSQHAGHLGILLPLALCAIAALFAAFARGLWLIAPELDLPLVLLCAFTGSVTAGLLVGGTGKDRFWSLRKSLAFALRVAGAELPVATAMVSTALVVGSSRPDALVEAQGSLPWQWTLFRSPLDLAAAMLCLLPLLAELNPASGELPEAELRTVGVPARRGAAAVLASLGDWVRLLVLAYLGALLFLGGWALPWVSSSAQRFSLGWQLVGAGCLSLKAAFLVLLVLVLRWISGRVRIDQVSGLCWRYLVPSSLGLLGLRIAWAEIQTPVTLGSLGDKLSLVLFGVCLFMVLRLVRTVVTELGKTSRPLGVNPWL